MQARQVVVVDPVNFTIEDVPTEDDLTVYQKHARLHADKICLSSKNLKT